ncbi:hypothetical protein [Acidithiobacillus sp.]|uniref:hypothetical protein n=1 Tax=Acidithiobacillus sp. TaxID=1872118 RepID=UPI003CFEFDF3
MPEIKGHPDTQEQHREREHHRPPTPLAGCAAIPRHYPSSTSHAAGNWLTV